MKAYKIFRGLLKASALTTVMFIMQACYGTPQPQNDPFFENEDEENYQAADTLSNNPVEVLDEIVE